MPLFRFSIPRCDLLVVAAALALVSTVGCGRGSSLEKIPVSGRVLFDGQPVPNGEIRFFPIDGTVGPVSGAPILDGAYVADSRGGVPAGKHRVEIRGYRAANRQLSGDAAVEGGPAEQYLPARFNSQSELTANVDDDHDEHNFDLTSD